MKKIVITGTSKGIGAELKKQLEPHNQVVSLNRPQYDLDDYTNFKNLDFADVDVLILNAAYNRREQIEGSIESVDFELMNKIVNANIISQLYLIQKYLQCRDQGTIVYISSAACTRRIPFTYMTPYGMTKNAIGFVIENLRHELKELGKTGIRLIDIKPGQTRDTNDLIQRVNMTPSTYADVARGIIMAIDHPDIINIDFRKT